MIRTILYALYTLMRFGFIIAVIAFIVWAIKELMKKAIKETNSENEKEYLKNVVREILDEQEQEKK